MAKEKIDILLQPGYDLFDHQPEACRKPLPFREIKADSYMKRVLFCDPLLFYERGRKIINPFKRYNYVDFYALFPDLEGVCSCGCGQPTKKNNKYATAECQRFAVSVWTIIAGKQGFPLYALTKYYATDTGVKCAKCGEPFEDLDHILPIARGGGSSWLSNYQFLCEECHKIKTASDNHWVNSKRFKKDKE